MTAVCVCVCVPIRPFVRLSVCLSVCVGGRGRGSMITPCDPGLGLVFLMWKLRLDEAWQARRGGWQWNLPLRCAPAVASVFFPADPYSHATEELESLRNSKVTKTTPGLAFPVGNPDSMAFEQFLSQAGNLLVMLGKRKAIWVWITQWASRVTLETQLPWNAFPSRN